MGSRLGKVGIQLAVIAVVGIAYVLVLTRGYYVFHLC